MPSLPPNRFFYHACVFCFLYTSVHWQKREQKTHMHCHFNYTVCVSDVDDFSGGSRWNMWYPLNFELKEKQKMTVVIFMLVPNLSRTMIKQFNSNGKQHKVPPLTWAVKCIHSAAKYVIHDTLPSSDQARLQYFMKAGGVNVVAKYLAMRHINWCFLQSVKNSMVNTTVTSNLCNTIQYRWQSQWTSKPIGQQLSRKIGKDFGNDLQRCIFSSCSLTVKKKTW